MISSDRASEEKLLGEGSDRSSVDSVPTRSTWRVASRRTDAWLWICQFVFFLTSCSLLMMSLVRESSSSQTCDCTEQTSMWSPALEAVRTTDHFRRFDGSFAAPNRYKGAPTPELDEAWADIAHERGGIISIGKEIFHAINASDEFAVQLAPELGGGYMASVEVLHQLHCLNVLRQATYEDYYRDKAAPWRDSPRTLRLHLDHCIDNLRQKLMCDADAGILTYVWAKGHHDPYPDFNVQHKCRDFRTLGNWITEHEVRLEKGLKIERQPGYKEVEDPP